VPRVTRVNAQQQARLLASKGPIVSKAVQSGQIKVVAAVYDIRSGRVVFFDPPSSGLG
jgi:carbonic anhydrase